MRIDLFHGGQRPGYMRLGLTLLGWFTGEIPGPPLAITYRPDLFPREFVGYILRSMHGDGGWDKGHAEMFAAFVSSLNRCRF